MPTAVLMSGQSEKAAGDSIRLPCDFGNEPAIIAGGRVNWFNVTCTGTPVPPSVTAKQLDYYYVLSALFTGGSPGSYECVYEIILDNTDATHIVRTGVLRVY